MVHASIRREGVVAADASTMTAAELMTALRLARDLEAVQAAPHRPSDTETTPAAAPTETHAGPRETEENVTSLVTARSKKD